MYKSTNIFVTVGTTKFDKLIETVTENNILQLFNKLGYKKLTLQIGHGKFEPKKSDFVEIEYYRLKDSILEDLKNADLVISHSGAGSCLEVLSHKKPLIAVINEDLMENHQYELAKKLADNKYIYYCTCSNMYTVLKDVLIKLDSLEQYENGQIELFSNYLNKCVGFINET